MKEFNLSEKAEAKYFAVDDGESVYLEEDVKEFIKRLKERINREPHDGQIIRDINELSGDKLI